MPPPTNSGTQKQTQLPAQPQPNPNNQHPQQSMYYVHAQKYPSYALNVVDIHLRSGTSLPVPKPPLITEIPDTPVTLVPTTSLPQMVDPTNVTSSTQTQIAIKPPFPQKLIQSKPTHIEEQYFDIIDQLKNMHIHIPLFQAIKDVPIYGKSIREACLKNPRRKKKDPTTVHVIG